MNYRATYSLIGQAGVLLALGVLSGADANAKHLSSEEALSMIQSVVRKSASTAPLKLAYTQETGDAESTVYIFNRDGAPGFYVLAADDAVGDIVLGYSHAGYFSVDNMSPGMQWLLEAYSMHVSSCAAGKVKAAPAQPPADWSAIEPLVTTKWTQTAPYNNMCPVVLGERSISGCVSVAVAQVMKKYQWPKTGKGSCSYSYTLNGKTYDISSDFSKHRYDWDNMLDSYTGASTQTQKDAVAQLIFDCGVMAQTRYIPDGYTIGSSGSLVKAAGGMLEYFDYDKSMQCSRKEWFSDQDWDKMIYEQISQGLPVLYSGQSYYGGHAFVLDGYDGAGLFHFNMGWGGLDDGYYSLDALEYNMDQEAVMNVRPNIGSSFKAEFAIEGNLVTDRAEYMANGERIQFMAEPDGGFLSYSLASGKAEIGVKNTANGSVAINGSTEFKPQSGLRSFSLLSKDFPKGEYDVYPVFRVAGGDWTPMKYNIAETSGRLHFINDGSKIRVQSVEVDGIISTEYDGLSVSAINGCIYIEAPYDVQISVYDVDGSLRYSGTDRIIPVENHRIYIVRVGDKVFKVKA